VRNCQYQNADKAPIESSQSVANLLEYVEKQKIRNTRKSFRGVSSVQRGKKKKSTTSRAAAPRPLSSRPSRNSGRNSSIARRPDRTFSAPRDPSLCNFFGNLSASSVILS